MTDIRKPLLLFPHLVVESTRITKAERPLTVANLWSAHDSAGTAPPAASSVRQRQRCARTWQAHGVGSGKARRRRFPAARPDKQHFWSIPRVRWWPARIRCCVPCLPAAQASVRTALGDRLRVCAAAWRCAWAAAAVGCVRHSSSASRVWSCLVGIRRWVQLHAMHTCSADTRPHGDRTLLHHARLLPMGVAGSS